MKIFKTLKLILIILFILSSTYALPKLSAILIIVDEYEDSEMNNISESVKRDLGTMGGFLNIIEKRNLYTVNKIILKGKDATRTKIQNQLKSINASSEDIILVYFSGHGGMDSRGTFLVTREGTNLYRSDIEKYVKDSKARLKILITDACSNDVEGIAVARSLRTSKSSKDGKYDTIYKKLFGEYSGFMNLSASSEGEYAWSDDNYGGYFTYYFIKEGLLKEPANNWNEIFASSRQKVVQMFNRIPSEQRTELRSEGINSQTPKAYSLPVLKSGAANTEIPVPPKKENAIINIKNTTKKTIEYFVEVESNDGKQVLESYSKKVSSGKSLSLSKECVIYFSDGNEEIGYEIGEGSYVFKTTKNGLIDLFPEGQTAEISDNYTAGEISSILVGLWEYDTPNEDLYAEFYDDGSFEIFDEQDYVVDQGDWEVYEEIFEGEVYFTLSLLSDDGFLSEYDIFNEDDYMIEMLPLEGDSDALSFLYSTE